MILMAERLRADDNEYVDAEAVLEVLDSVLREPFDADAWEEYSESVYYGNGVLVEYGSRFTVERPGVDENATLLWTARRDGRDELIVGGDMDDRIYTEIVERGGLEGWMASQFADYDTVRDVLPLDDDGRLDKNHLVVGRSPERGLQVHWQEGDEDGPRSAVYPSPYVDELDLEVYVEPVEEGLVVLPLRDDVEVTVEERYRS